MGRIKGLMCNLFPPRNWKMDLLNQKGGRNIRMLKINWVGMLTLESFQVWRDRTKISFNILNHQTGSVLVFLSAEGLDKKHWNNKVSCNLTFNAVLANSLRPWGIGQLVQQSQIYRFIATWETTHQRNHGISSTKAQITVIGGRVELWWNLNERRVLIGSSEAGLGVKSFRGIPHEVWGMDPRRGPGFCYLGTNKDKCGMCSETSLWSSALGWKLKLPLYVKVTWVLQARVGCFILTDKISNSKISDNLILGNKVSWQVRNSSRSKWGLLRHVTAAVCPWDTWCFLLTLQLDLSIFPAWCGMLRNVAGQVLVFSVWANSFLYCY